MSACERVNIRIWWIGTTLTVCLGGEMHGAVITYRFTGLSWVVV